MAREIFNRVPMLKLEDPEQPSVPSVRRPKPQQRAQQQPTPSSATLPKATKANTCLNHAVSVTGVSESNFDPVNFSVLSDLGKKLRVGVVVEGPVEGSQTVCPTNTNCPRPRGNNDVEKDICSQIQCPSVNSRVQSIKLKKKKIQIIKIKKIKTITTNEHCCAKPNHQFIGDMESNTSVGAKAHKEGVHVTKTKTNGYEMVGGSPPFANDAVSFDHIDVACQGSSALQECPFGETGTNIFC